MIDVFKHSFMITGFVAVMMLVIEYLNVATEGEWQERLADHKWGQYFLAGLLGATPGCLGAFAVVAMYTHRRISIGALAAAMIATSGDESFVMFATVPHVAFPLTLLLFTLGVATGAATDFLLRGHMTTELSCKDDFRIHNEEAGKLFVGSRIPEQWKNCSATRGILAVGLVLFLAAIATGQVGPHDWNWVRVTIIIVSALALFIVVTVSDHFLDEHLWSHVIRGHVPRIFLWTLAAILLLHLLIERWNLSELILRGKWFVMFVAGMIGLVPESGPHLMFVTMFAKGVVPFSVLLASSIVQDGHGMLPLLAHSRRAFLAVKLINLAVGLIAGALVMLLGH